MGLKTVLDAAMMAVATKDKVTDMTSAGSNVLESLNCYMDAAKNYGVDAVKTLGDEISKMVPDTEGANWGCVVPVRPSTIQTDVADSAGSVRSFNWGIVAPSSHHFRSHNVDAFFYLTKFTFPDPLGYQAVSCPTFVSPRDLSITEDVFFNKLDKVLFQQLKDARFRCITRFPSGKFEYQQAPVSSIVSIVLSVDRRHAYYEAALHVARDLARMDEGMLPVSFLVLHSVHCWLAVSIKDPSRVWKPLFDFLIEQITGSPRTRCPQIDLLVRRLCTLWHLPNTKEKNDLYGLLLDSFLVMQMHPKVAGPLSHIITHYYELLFVNDELVVDLVQDIFNPLSGLLHSTIVYETSSRFLID